YARYPFLSWPPADSFNHLVGASEQCGWNIEPERLGCFEIDKKLKLAGLINWQIRRLITLDNAPDIQRTAAISISHVVSIAHQPTLNDKIAVGVHSGDGIARRQRDDLLAPG